MTTSMTVPTLVQSLANLMHVLPPLSLFVGPRWELLDHDGFIVSRLLPDAITPCPYLQPGSFVRVFSRRPPDSTVFSAVFGLAAPTRLVRPPSSSSELGLSAPPSNVFIGDTSLPLVNTDFSSFPASGLDHLPSSISNSSRNGENRGPAIFNLQRNGENRGDVERENRGDFGRVSSTLEIEGRENRGDFGRKNRGDFGRISSSLEIGERRSSLFGEQHSSPSFAGDSLLDEISSENDSSPPQNSPKRLRYSSETLGCPEPLPVIPADSETTLADTRRVVVQRQIHLMNTSSVVDGETPHELVYRTRPSRKTMGSDSTSSGKEMDTSSWPRVTRRERSELLKKFRKEQKLDRRRFKLEVTATWDAEMAADKDNYLHEQDPRDDSSLLRFPVNPEDEAEAYENYLFDRMMVYDRDSADLLFDFRSSLQVVPSLPTQVEEDPALIRNRTAALWAGLRRVYFGEKETEPSRQAPELTHEEVMDNLRREIAEIEERLRLRRSPDSERPILPLPRDDDSDDPPPSFAHTNVIPDATSGVLVAHVTVQETPSPSDRTSDSTESGSPDRELSSLIRPIRKLVFLSKRVLRRIMAAKESLFKFGTFVPKNDREAESSPEASRWKAAALWNGFVSARRALLMVTGRGTRYTKHIQTTNDRMWVSCSTSTILNSRVNTGSGWCSMARVKANRRSRKHTLRQFAPSRSGFSTSFV